METSSKDTQEEDLRRWVTNRRKNDVPQPLWKKLKNDDYVGKVLDPNDPYSRKDLLDEVNELLQYARQMAPYIGIQSPFVGGDDGGGRGQDDYETKDEDEQHAVPRFIDSPVYKRGEAFTWYLLKLAAADSLVKEFRQRVLGGGTVSYDDAVALLDSPAAAVFPSDWFEEMGVPFVGHKAQLVEGEWPPAEESSRVRGKIKVEWDAGEMLSDYEGVAPFQSLELMIYSEKSLGLPKLVALEDSVLGVLLKLAQRISERFPWWRVQNIPELVLRGRAPMVGLPFEWFYQPGLTHSEPEYNRRRSRIYQSITLEVPPWFSVENVSEEYKSVKGLIPTKPQPSPRRLALFEFVMRHPKVTVPGEGQVPKVPSWAELFRTWNELLPAGYEWRYDDRRNFRRDFLKAFDQIVNYYR